MPRRPRIEIDFEWKPEPDPEPQTVPSQSGNSAQQAPDQTPYKGVMIIAEYDCSPPRFEVIKDKDKKRLRFPFGGMKTTDMTSQDGANRETSEEIGLELGLDPKKHFIGELSGGPSCTIYVFTKTIPWSLASQVKIGDEQEDHAPFTADHIDSCIEKGLLARNHANGWKMRKAWREKQLAKI